MSDTDVTELALGLYDTVLSPERWSTALLKVAEFLGGTGVIIFEHQPGETGLHIRASHLSGNYSDELTKTYLKRYAKHELEDQFLFEQTSMNTDGVELISDDVLWHGHTPLSARPNARFLRAFGLRHRAAALLNKDDPSRDRFSVQFAAHRGAITADEITRAALILPHVAKALAISRSFQNLNDSRSIALRSLDRLQLGVAVTDHLGRSIFENNGFRRIAEECGLIRHDSGGRLTLREARGQAKLAALFTDLGRHGRFGARPRKEAVVIERDDGVHGICVEVCPLARAADISSARVDGYLVTCLDTRTVLNVDLGNMSKSFSLTRAEERILAHVTNGHSNAQIAELSFRSVDTVTSHIKALLAKTGCENRTQLVRLAVGLGQRAIFD